MAQDTQSRPLSRIVPHWARPTHPVYERELQSWQRTRGWRWLRAGCAPSVFVVFVLMGCACSLMTIGTAATTREQLALLGLSGLWSLLVSQGFVVLVTGLIATALTAPVISGELESQTYGLLRVTGVPTDEIILAKYAAALRQLRAPLVIVIAARLLIVVAAIPLVDWLLRVDGTIGGLPGLLGQIPLEPVSPLSFITALLSVLAWLGYFLLLPVLTVMLHASIGLFASSLTRTRTNGFIAAAGLRVAFAILRGIIGQTFSVSGLTWISTLPSPTLSTFWLEQLVVTQPALLITLVGLLALGALLWNIGWRGGLTYILVRSAVNRAYRLPFE